MNRPRVSIVVPSFRRPQRLGECLAGISALTTQPDEVVLVLRPEDLESVAVAEDSELPGVLIAWVTRPGVLAAMVAGVELSTGDSIAFLDDDTVPRPDWLERMLVALSEPDVGGAGGRDIVTDPDQLPRVREAGLVTAWGKMIGDHHRVEGSRRDVDVLKGANMVFRRAALALPVHLLGSGAQVHFEVATCLWARARGWRLVLDPGAEVLHLPGERFDADARSGPSGGAILRAACNLTWCLLSVRPRLMARRLLYGMLVGDKGVPGLGRALAALVRRERGVARRLLPSLVGQFLGAVLVLSGRRVQMRVFDHAPIAERSSASI